MPGAADQDCADSPQAASSDGTGPEPGDQCQPDHGQRGRSGSGGGLRLQTINGTEVVNFPDGRTTTGRAGHPSRWNTVKVTNNIIANNVAGWDGGGVSLQDALAVNFVNNTIVSNDSTASSGVLFDTFVCAAGEHAQAGISDLSTAVAIARRLRPPVWSSVAEQRRTGCCVRPASGVNCPAGHFAGSNQSGSNATCSRVLVPASGQRRLLAEPLVLHRCGPLGGGHQNQQNVVALFNQSGRQPQPADDRYSAANGNGIIITGGTGACDAPVELLGHRCPRRHRSDQSRRIDTRLRRTRCLTIDRLATLAPTTNGGNPTVMSQYCNGSRVPPELGAAGLQGASGNQRMQPCPLRSST